VCFEDEAGQNLRPPKARTWARRGRTPVVTVSGKGSGRVSVAGLVCLRPGAQGHLFYRVRVHRGRKGERRSMSEADYADLITAAHQELHAPVILIWDYVVRHIIPVLCPAVLCGQRRLAVLVTGGDGLGGAVAGHIMLGLREAASSIP
jgi:putative transposase